MLSRHIVLIFCVALCSLLITAVYLFHQTPVYEATTTLRIDPGRAGSLGFNDPLASSPSENADFVRTEIAVLQSDSVAVRTLNSLNQGELVKYAGPVVHEPFLAAGAKTLTRAQSRLLDSFKLHTRVKQEEGTQLVDVSFRDKDPNLAAVVVNKLVAAYAVQGFSSRDQSVAQLQSWLSSQLEELRQRVESSQEKLAQFQQANDIIGTTDASNTTTDRLKLLNEALTGAQATRIGKEAQMRVAATGGAAALIALFPNSRLQALQAQQGVLYARYVELSAKFGPNYAPLAEVKRELDSVNEEVSRGADEVRSQLQHEYASSLKNETLLQQEYDDQKSQAFAFNRNQAEYAVLQSQVVSARELYDTLQRRLQQATVNAQISGVNTSVLDSARAPLTPVAPKKALLLSGGLLLGILLGIASALLIENDSECIRSVAQIERLLHTRILAIIPKPDSTDGGLNLPSDTPSQAGNGIALSSEPRRSEGFRTLRANLLAVGGTDVRTIVFATALPVRGCTEAIVALGISLARTGTRVLLIDADLHRPSLHQAFGLANEPGLGNYLMGDDHGQRLMRPVDAEKNLCLLTAGKLPTHPGEALGSLQFRSLLRSWAENFDYVLMLAAPLLAVSDGLPMLGWSDATVVAVPFAENQQQELVQLNSALNRAGASVAGLVILNMPTEKVLQGNRSFDLESYYA